MEASPPALRASPPALPQREGAPFGEAMRMSGERCEGWPLPKLL